MKTLRRIALALIIIGAINWGLVGLFRYDLVGSIFGGTDSGFARFIFTLVGISGIICLGLLFNPETADVPERKKSRGVANTSYATEFAEEPDLDRLYNPSREAFEEQDEEDPNSSK
ncbi:DUF378 domain-containing protein [Lederbergia citrea]|uniref:DUF378 domain-containing protein n=1 Tax=Lederbergia citrea TaxID=2833581 RepID=UPI001BC92A0A|nr:DUF378 domain-containing protein [Lederbergia citrea]MBS4177621.1 DUF378 domain-containing protein [Lederbergia citrea]MBS4204294.1 DUF378 domain-containing protein [Lederbergia citrea]